MPPSRDFFHFVPFLSTERARVITSDQTFRPARRVLFFSLLDTICVQLALAIASTSQTRYKLLGPIVAGK